MRLELLDMPSRRNSILPELKGFFEQTGDPQWQLQFERFLRTFAGTEFVVPPPQTLEDIRRDERIISQLKSDQSVEGRLRILRDFRIVKKKDTDIQISHQYLCTLWSVCEGRELEPPPARSREDAIQQAIEWSDKFPSLKNDIMMMFAISAHERPALDGRKRKKKKKHAAKR